MGGCSPPSPLDIITGFFSFLGDPIGTLVRMIANLMLAAAISIFAELSASVPTLGTTTEGGPDDVPSLISDQIEWVVTYLAIGSVLFAAARMAMERKGTAGRTALQGFLRVILVAGAGSWVVGRAASLSDGFSDHLLKSAAMQVIMGVPCVDNGSSIESFLLLVLAFLLLIAAIVHVLMLYLRLGVMTIMLGTLPLAAAASMTNWGAGWWRKHIGWTVAWLLYKPAVGLIMFSGAEMLAVGSRTQNSSHIRIAGIGVLLLSAIALPALLKIVVPATAALGTGDPTGTAVSAAGGMVASGAKRVAGSALSSGGGGGGAPSGARGPQGSRGDTGRQGPSGSEGRSGRNAGSSAGGTAAAGSAARLAGPVGAAIDGAHRAARTGRNMVAGTVSGADGDAGHN
ncbi:hypothetical protein TPA0907_26050 [Micromonospora humidisoli]|uniref:TrbL/VirB6 plasmid conjugal transfer protein n=1 Tax=Micromonospora humidisoli TaxID=2807622 RepID=A0ABS2JHN9_9ACTN|nr:MULTISPECIES: hypothetical protein [Micromonospora]MBM7084989.1 hypothetical protein [Micromonospora humidisoli]GHJ08238.1 hypothetical protein TPA0907_26050 [Micromonospora sp. AKA109]